MDFQHIGFVLLCWCVWGFSRGFSFDTLILDLMLW